MWSWIAGIGAVIVVALTMKKWKWAPLLGLFVQSFWFIYVFVEKQWGLLLPVIAYTIIYAIGSYTWLKKNG